MSGDKALMSSFATYVSLMAEAHTECAGDMLAYMHLIIREADGFGGSGWLSYHAVFHRNHVPCRPCHNIDHVSTEHTVTVVLPGTHDNTSAFLLHMIIQDRSGLKGEQPVP